MIKKLVLFSLLVIAGVACFGQDHLYISPSFKYRLDFGEGSNVCDLNLNLQYDKQITDIAWTRFSYGFGARVVDSTFGPTIGISYGVFATFNDFYILLDLKPTIKCVGNGSQIYGDELALGIIPRIGVGYNLNISDICILYLEMGGFKDFNIIYTRNDMNINSFGIYFNIGFRFKHI